MNFREQIRSLAAPPKRGIEIGPSYRPILPKRDGFDTVIIDHASADDLKAKYEGREDVSGVEDVDVVWRSGALEDQFGGERFDWIVASHVIEHVPDIIGFLHSCERLLNEDGKLFLAIPDKRRTFDFVKPHLEVGTAMQRHREQRSRHDFATVFTAYNDHILVDGRGDFGVLPINQIQLAADPHKARNVAEEAIARAEYFDCHANYLTPASFLLLLLELRMLGLTRMAGDVLPTVGCEFYATLSPLPQRDVAVSLNDYQEEKTRLRLQMFEELDDQLARLKASPAWEHYRRQPRQN